MRPAGTLRPTAAVLIVALALIALPTAGAAQAGKKYEALLGTWDVKTEDGGREFVFEFFLKDNKLAGKFTGASGTSEMAGLTFEDNTVKFSVTVGNGMVIDYSAIVAEDKLSGTLSLQYGEAGITGTRRK
jgi:hypothetical protein